MQLMKDHERGDMVKIDWLDRLAFRQIEKVHTVGPAYRASDSRNTKRTSCTSMSTCQSLTFRSYTRNRQAPNSAPSGASADVQEGMIPQPPVPLLPPPSQLNMSALPPDMLAADPHLWRIFDPDAWRDNPVETKHRKLLRSQRLGDEGRDLKPGPADRDRLNVSRVCLPR
jgi:phosphatidylinositol 3-kinase